MKRIIREHLRRKALVTLKSGESFGGVLYSVDSEALTLRNASLLDASSSDRVAQPVDGELLVLRPDIAYIQFP